jgi:hypothetical protein
VTRLPKLIKSPFKKPLESLGVLTIVLCFGGSGAAVNGARPPAVQTGDASAVAADCKPETRVKPGFKRIYIALRNGKDGSGKSPADARDGSSAETFDRILRCYAEGCSDATAPGKSVPKTENLIVCLSPGTFQTRGTYDFVVNVAHKTHEGFTLGKGWKIHGSGKDRTTVQLSAYLPVRAVPNPQNLPARTGMNVVLSTNSDAASDVEISDLTIDANYPALKAQAAREGIRALNLEAIHLRSDQGHNWIHDINVVGTAGEVGQINVKWETFPVWIYSVRPNSTPRGSSGNVIERVNMSSYGGGACTAIAMANVLGEVRDNKVEGYQIGYGGWLLGPVWFHDNVAVGTQYGFNIDSLVNQGVRIERNQIMHPRNYGIVIGGGGTYNGFIIANNTVRIDQPGVVGLLFQGNVRDAVVQGNSFLWEGSGSLREFLVGATAIRNSSEGGSRGANRNNVYRANKINDKLKVVFRGPSRREESCATGNSDENGRPLRELPDNHTDACAALIGTGNAAR